MNAWVLHYSRDIYGPDPEVFRPERWIGHERTSIIDSMMNISLLELTKVVPEIVRKVDLELEHPGKPLETTCVWFVYPRYSGSFKVRDAKA